jgi:hypothetical protein
VSQHVSHEAVDVTIDGETYRLRRWSTDDGVRWFFRASQLVLTARRTVPPEERGVLFLAMFQLVDEPTFMELVGIVRRQTDVVGSLNGERTERPLVELPMHLRGRHDVLLELVHAHLEREFTGPFSRLVTKLPRPSPVKVESSSRSPEE